MSHVIGISAESALQIELKIFQLAEETLVHLTFLNDILRPLRCTGRLPVDPIPSERPREGLVVLVNVESKTLDNPCQALCIMNRYDVFEVLGAVDGDLEGFES